MRIPPTLLALAGPFALAGASFAQSTATYDVVFEATWSQSNHPGAFVSTAHFSPLIGGVHTDELDIWGPGQFATNGVEVMAETGSPTPLQTEITAAINAGTAREVILGGSVAVSPGQASAGFTVTDEYPLVSLVTMIAPSPDWFIGVHDLSLLGPDGWVEELTVDLFAYDSGTDSGPGLTSPNQNTNPQEPIALLGGFFGSEPLGTFRFERRHGSFAFGANPEGSLTVGTGEPVIGSSLALRLNDPIGAFPTPAISILALSLNSSPAIPLPGFGLGTPGGTGDVLIGNPFLVLSGGTFGGSPLDVPVALPNNPALVGLDLFAQGAFADPVSLLTGLTQAVELNVGQ